MTDKSIYNSIATRTQGDIYIGVVGPVRSGKSTFIKKFMEVLVLPNIDSTAKKSRAIDELPQSASGRTIMTTEPKFIPENAVEITIDDVVKCNVRLIDCVGYIVPSSLGYIENDVPRMVKTPWFDKEVPFNMAAEIGTQKVITEHSTIGLVITTDGSIGEISRDEYIEAEDRVINELQEIHKPFIVLLNCKDPKSDESVALAQKISSKHGVGVLPINCMELDETQIQRILSLLLYEFPIREMQICIAPWITQLEKGHWLKNEIYNAISDGAKNMKKVKDSNEFINNLKKLETVNSGKNLSVNLSEGSVKIEIEVKPELFYKVLTENTGLEIKNDKELFESMIELSAIKKEYSRFKEALEEVEKTGYGIVMPTMQELSLEEPEIMKQGGRYGVRLKASAPSIHMMKANITTEVAPIVGTESQSEELIMYLLKGFEEDPSKIWESNIFGKSLNSLVNEGLHNKLYKMPTDARMKLQETLERVINEGCSGLICIII